MLRRLWRIPSLVALLFGGLFTVFVVFPLVGPGRREWLIATWSRMLVGACGALIVERAPDGRLTRSTVPQGAVRWLR